jgi:hypothetical protein
MASITGATATFQLAVGGVFDLPLQLKGFAADDVFDSPEVESSEVLMGVDGRMSSGFVYVPIKQGVTLQADSPSMFIFDGWWAANKAARDNFIAQGTIWLKALGQKWVLTNGVLTSVPPMPAVKKLIQPRKFTITWEDISAAPV